MNRREAIKVAGLTAIVAAVGVQAAATAEAPKNRIEMKPKDPKNKTNAELKHSPKITLKEKDANGYTLVEISVGQGGIIHPSIAGHWIDYIELYANGELVGKSVLEAEISRGATAFAVKLDNVKELKAKAGCNLHGIWTTIVNI